MTDFTVEERELAGWIGKTYWQQYSLVVDDLDVDGLDKLWCFLARELLRNHREQAREIIRAVIWRIAQDEGGQILHYNDWVDENWRQLLKSHFNTPRGHEASVPTEDERVELPSVGTHEIVDGRVVCNGHCCNLHDLDMNGLLQIAEDKDEVQR